MVLLLSALILATSLTFFVSPASVQHKRTNIDAVQDSMTSLMSDATDLLNGIKDLPTTDSAPLSSVIATGIVGLSTIESATTLLSDITALGQPITDPTDLATMTQQLTTFHSIALEGINAFVARKNLAENAFKGSGFVILTSFQTLGNNLMSALQKVAPPSSQAMLNTYKQDLDQAFATAFNEFPACGSLIGVQL